MQEFQRINSTIVSYDQRIGFVYLVAEQELEYVKIGYSAEPNKRLCSLQNSNPRQLYLLYTVFTKDMSVLEKELHKEFSHLIVRGEWFKYDYSIIERFEQLLSPNIPEDALLINERLGIQESYIEKYHQNIHSYYKTFVNLLDSQIFPDDELKIGKYKGKTIGHIKKIDKGYYNWLFREPLKDSQESYELKIT